MSLTKKQKTVITAIIMDDLTTTLLSPGIIFSQIMEMEVEAVSQLYWLPNVFREKHDRVPLYYEEWIGRYINMDFFKLFRMTRPTMEYLTFKISSVMKRNDIPHTGGRKPVQLEKCVLMTLWYLGKGDTLISITDRFNISQSTTFEKIHEIIQLIVMLLPEYIVWPTKTECNTIINGFYKRSRYPNVIGAIDGCNIHCKVPAAQQESYLDRKFQHSIKLQGVCTSSNLLTNVSIGFPGSIHDARVLKESALGRAIERNGVLKWFYSNNYHLVGDSAYPLKTWLMKPFRDTGNLNKQQKHHNLLLNMARVAIENTFGLLKGRWRILCHINVYTVEAAINIIAATCMLHNFCLMKNNQFEVFPNIENYLEEDYTDVCCTQEDVALNKRNIILSQM